jgi:RNA polymerase sigma-70 factor, ECF subfamily
MKTICWRDKHEILEIDTSSCAVNHNSDLQRSQENRVITVDQATTATTEHPGIHRDYLFRFAMRRVGNQELADDLVQETMLAALQSKNPATAATMGGTAGDKAGFGGRSTYRVWLAGILKHKMMDALREKRKFVPLTITDDDGEDSEFSPALMELQANSPNANDPQQACELSELLAQIQQAISSLPAGVAEVFMAREIEGESTESIAARSGLSEANIWVRVHRARKALQAHLADCGAVQMSAGSAARWAA